MAATRPNERTRLTSGPGAGADVISLDEIDTLRSHGAPFWALVVTKRGSPAVPMRIVLCTGNRRDLAFIQGQPRNILYFELESDGVASWIKARRV